MTLETDKILGGAGAILLVIGLLPVVGTDTFGVIGLVGLILLFIALYDLSRFYKENGIFTNAIYALVIGVVGAVLTAIVAVIAILTSLNALENFIIQFYPNWTKGDWTALRGMTPITPKHIDFTGLGTFLAAVLAAFVVFVAFMIVATYFLRRSLRQLSAKTAVGLFSTAGLIMFIGAILLFVLVIPGLVALWVGLIVLAVAFFQIKPQPEQPLATVASPPSSMPTPV